MTVERQLSDALSRLEKAHAENARLNRRIVSLQQQLAIYECECGVTADPISAHRHIPDPPDREVFECR